MFNTDLWNEIFQSINKNKLRSILSGFTILFAILIFTLLSGISNGLQNTFSGFFSDDASNTIFLRSGRTSKPYKGNQTGKRINFSNEDYEYVKHKYDDKIQFITARVYKNFTGSYKGKKNDYNIRAVHPDHQYLENTKVVYGRYLNNNDIDKKLKYVVIGRLVVEDLFGNKNPIGKQITLQGISFQVIGTFEDDGGDNEERLIYMPVTTAQSIFSNKEYIKEIRIAYSPKMNYAQTLAFSKKLTEDFKERFSVAPNDQRAIRTVNFAERRRDINQMTFVIGLMVIFIGFGSLIAGIVGISNIMVYIVKERTKELGIRKVLGAKPGSIVMIILLESIVITSIAGYVGMLIGIGTLSLIGDSLEDYFITDPSVSSNLVVSAMIILIIAGCFAGYLPAKRAARIKPIVALRND
ncbi:ABC transporter permease [Flavicella sp.]|uniref:ABC transporter permease n=1 Tax=Flavicella sp. TaxID=2957742 RepID=UPI0026378DDD|nr:ABC transporter permease [Flavicella sp.]MDG1803580.1 ABC transporter permease [Flavicella sp.]